MDWKLELVFVPVSDVDRAKSFYADQVGFNADYDEKVSDTLRFVQLTPPGSACSIAIGTGLIDSAPGSLRNLQIVVDDVAAARKELIERGVGASDRVPRRMTARIEFATASRPCGADSSTTRASSSRPTA